MENIYKKHENNTPKQLVVVHRLYKTKITTCFSQHFAFNLNLCFYGYTIEYFFFVFCVPLLLLLERLKYWKIACYY